MQHHRQTHTQCRSYVAGAWLKRLGSRYQIPSQLDSLQFLVLSFWFFAMADFVLVFMFFHRVINCVHFPWMTPSLALNSAVIFSNTELFFKIVFLSFCLLLIIPSRDSTRSYTTDFLIAVKFGDLLGLDILSL